MKKVVLLASVRKKKKPVHLTAISNRWLKDQKLAIFLFQPSLKSQKFFSRSESAKCMYILQHALWDIKMSRNTSEMVWSVP